MLSRVGLAAAMFARLVLGAAHALAEGLSRAVAALRRSLLAVLHAVRRSAGLLLLAVQSLALALSRAAAALKPSPRRRPVRRHTEEQAPTHVAEAVLTWVLPRAEPLEEPPSTIEPAERDAPAEIAVPVATAVPDAAAVEPRPPKAPSARPRRGGLTVLASLVVVAVIAAVLVPLQMRNDNSAPTRAAAAAAPNQPVPSRSEFSDARQYGAAMTRLALTSGRTEIDGDVACDQNSTFDRWGCVARGKPSLGAYAGRWLTYRCTPTATPQPGGRPDAVMINCAPQNPPATH
jgi:hypothetical protein